MIIVWIPFENWIGNWLILSDECVLYLKLQHQLLNFLRRMGGQRFVSF
jgi:hypothetical protein